MSANNHPENDEALDKLLRRWNVNSSLPPRFQEQVWHRIAKAETQPAPSPWAVLWRLIEVALPRPRLAYAYLAVLLAAGVTAGSVTAQIRTSHLHSELSLRYVQSVDPYRAELAQR
jgi:hypothetical protein